LAPAIFADNDSKPNARTTVAGVAKHTQFEQAITQRIPHDGYRRRRGSNRNWRRCRAILRRNHNPRSVTALAIAGILIVPVPARAGLAL
jgi:hypothetical protein